MTAPAISVVIPVHNRAERLGPVLASVQAQSLADFECLVVDDGSDDGAKLAETVAALGDPRFTLLRRARGGGSAARNTGIERARGAHVAFLDSDDFYLPHHLAAAAAVLERTPHCAVHARLIVARGKGLYFLKPPRGLAPNEHMADYLLCGRGFVQTSTLVVPTAFARRVRYREGLPYGQDTDFAIRLFNAGLPFTMLEAPSAIWSDTSDPNRVSRNRDPEARIAWLNEIAPAIPPRAYAGDLGWTVAKFHARAGNPARALALYLRAVLAGCYRPRLALAIALQILLPDAAYRALADTVLALRARLLPARLTPEPRGSCAPPAGSTPRDRARTPLPPR